MKKVIIKYYYIKSDHIFAKPEYDHEEIVEGTDKQIENYILKQKDQYGHLFKQDKSFGFNYISNQGAVKVLPYKEKIIKLRS